MHHRAFCVATLFLLLPCTFAQQRPQSNQAPSSSAVPAAEEKPSFADAPAALATLLESNIRAEWEAIKKRDKEAYGKLLTDDFIEVESDGDGARNRYKAANELGVSFVTDYHLQLFKTYSFAPNITYVRYECTMEFPKKSAQRYKRMWISEIWVKQGSAWKLWRYQETPVK